MPDEPPELGGGELFPDEPEGRETLPPEEPRRSLPPLEGDSLRPRRSTLPLSREEFPSLLGRRTTAFSPLSPAVRRTVRRPLSFELPLSRSITFGASVVEPGVVPVASVRRTRR